MSDKPSMLTAIQEIANRRAEAIKRGKKCGLGSAGRWNMEKKAEELTFALTTIAEGVRGDLLMLESMRTILKLSDDELAKETCRKLEVYIDATNEQLDEALKEKEPK